MIQAIDPPECGCTDCITGYSVPLHLATADQVAALLGGSLDDRTSASFGIRTTIVVTSGPQTWVIADREVGNG